jgi:hypothetical protein
MGNGFLFNNFKINECCPNKNSVTDLAKTDQVLTRDISQGEAEKEKESNIKTIKQNSLHGIISYFNEVEKEILTDIYKQQDKDKKYTRNKDNTRYELMLQRLLEQQNIKKVGPKRRETIRNKKNKIKEMVKQILQENKNEILKNTNIKDINDENITLLITQQEKIERWSQSQTMDKKILMQNNIKKIPVNKND